MRWTLIISVLIGLTSISGAPITGSQMEVETSSAETVSTSSSSLSSARKLPSHDVGLPSELAWQAWLVVANKPDAQSSFESATVPRRISPKSVFIAPELQPSCSDGYKADVMGRCVKETIQINYKSHLEFILERLRSKFPSTIQLDDSSATGPELKESAASGPLQVNISLGIEENLSASNRSPQSVPSNVSDPETEGSSESVEISVVHVSPTLVHKPDGQTEAVLTAYQVGNDTNNREEEEGTFFRGNSSKDFGHTSIREVLVPVAEILEDGNRTVAEIVDYEIPLSLGSLFNTSGNKPSKNGTETKPVDDAQQPTVVLLLSPTKITAATSTPNFKDQETGGDRISVGTGNSDVNSTRRDQDSDDILPYEDSEVEEEEEPTSTDDYVEETTISDLPDTLGTTNHPEEDLDDGTESIDEILTHGEAGMLVSSGKFHGLIGPEETSTNAKIGDDNDANISSESSITGDVIVETTILDLNTGTTPTHLKPDDHRELFEAERDVDLEPEVVFSPQDARRLERPIIRGKKRADELNPDSSSSLSTTQDDSSTLDSIRREETVQHSSFHKADEETSSRGPSLGGQNHPQQRRRTSSSQDYVRFPGDDQRPSSSSSYVLFPSENHSNSINGEVNSKDRSSTLAEERSQRPQLVPIKNSVPLHQKKTYWHLPPGWRIEDLQPPRLQQQQQQHTAGLKNDSQRQQSQNQNQNQNPLLFRFWTRMPLFRDPSLTTTTNGQSSSRTIYQRDGIYRSVLPQGQNRSFGQVIG